MPSASEAASACWDAGHAFLAARDLKAATHSFREAVRIDPEFGEAYMDLGACLGEQGLWPDCAAAHRRALELIPEYFEAFRNLGVALTELEDYQGSEAQFRSALTLRPGDPDTLLRLGYVLSQRSEYAAALQMFEAVIEAQPDNADAHILAARELVHFGRRDEARAALEKARTLKPGAVRDQAEIQQLWESLGGV